MHYEQVTSGIRVRARPRFSLSDSDPEDGVYVFSYEIEMENEGDIRAQLLFRHWRIHDSIGDDTEVDGEGIVGMKPVLQPGESHTYQSFCVLRSPVGYMEGYYTFARPDGQLFRVDVPRFELNGPFVLPNRVQAVDPRDDAPVMN